MVRDLNKVIVRLGVCAHQRLQNLKLRRATWIYVWSAIQSSSNLPQSKACWRHCCSGGGGGHKCQCVTREHHKRTHDSHRLQGHKHEIVILSIW